MLYFPMTWKYFPSKSQAASSLTQGAVTKVSVPFNMCLGASCGLVSSTEHLQPRSLKTIELELSGLWRPWMWGTGAQASVLRQARADTGAPSVHPALSCCTERPHTECPRAKNSWITYASIGYRKCSSITILRGHHTWALSRTKALLRGAWR